MSNFLWNSKSQAKLAEVNSENKNQLLLKSELYVFYSDFLDRQSCSMWKKTILLVPSSSCSPFSMRLVIDFLVDF